MFAPINVNRGNVSPLRGEKPIFGPVSKNNTGMAALRAGLSVIIIIITKTIFMVLSSWQSYCESSPGSFDECRTAPSGRRPKTKPDDVSPPVQAARNYTHHRHLLLLLSPKADTHFTVPRRVKG